MPARKNAATHISALDGWRGLAICVLLAGHFTSTPGINLGGVGVSLFFVLSGMLMARLLFIQKVDLQTFYLRRFSRVVPAHLCFIVAIAVFYRLSGIAIFPEEIPPAAFFYNNYVPTNSMPYGHIWSLSVEEHSYIALSLIAVATRYLSRSPTIVLGVLALICGAMHFYYSSQPQFGRDLYAYLLHTEVAAYGIVVSAFLCMLFHRFGTPTTQFWVVPMLVVTGICLHWWRVPGPIQNLVGVGLFALAVNLLPAATEVVKAVFSNSVLRKLGFWSFSIYLWQQPLYVAHLNKDVSVPIALGCTLFLSLFSFYLVERPCRTYLNRHWSAFTEGKKILLTDAT